MYGPSKLETFIRVRENETASCVGRIENSHKYVGRQGHFESGMSEFIGYYCCEIMKSS